MGRGHARDSGLEVAILAKKRRQILVLNSGSSSLKLSLFDVERQSLVRLFDAHLKGLNHTEQKLEIVSSTKKENYSFERGMGVGEALRLILETAERDFGFHPSKVAAIGHRVVHGGEKFQSSIAINAEVRAALEALSELAPLHNDASLAGIKAAFDHFGDLVPEIAVFDTAFHSTMPEVASHYAIDHTIAAKYPIKRYGFHGISHAFLWETYVQSSGQSLSEAKIITLHLGNGCSMAAIKGGRSIDTSMGFTPTEGLVMATRSGDIDAGVIEFLCTHEKMSPVEVLNFLNLQSGLLGLSGSSSNMEVLVDSYETDGGARLAIDLSCYRAIKYIGAYLAVLKGADALIFSGGIGENSPKVREGILRGMEWFGVEMSSSANAKAVGLPLGQMRTISAASSIMPVYVIATDENLFIAKEVHRLKKGS